MIMIATAHVIMKGRATRLISAFVEGNRCPVEGAGCNLARFLCLSNIAIVILYLGATTTDRAAQLAAGGHAVRHTQVPRFTSQLRVDRATGRPAGAAEASTTPYSTHQAP